MTRDFWRATLRVQAVICALAAGVAIGVGRVQADPAGDAPEAAGDRTDACLAFDHDHAAWTSLLLRFVRDGQVDYAGLKRSGERDLAEYLQSLGAVCSRHYEQWSREEKLAFWINTYNAATVRLILDNYPIDSIRRIGFLPGAAFRLSFVSVPAVRSSALSLNDIEHEILRKQFDEPRIHFAIVCASKSCPRLRSEAYRARDLDRQLEEAARGFARDITKNRFDAGSHVLYLSSIFQWFHEDFEKAAGSLPAFFARFADPTTATEIRSGHIEVEFLDYDWSLNGRTP